MMLGDSSAVFPGGLIIDNMKTAVVKCRPFERLGGGGPGPRSASGRSATTCRWLLRRPSAREAHAPTLVGDRDLRSYRTANSISGLLKGPGDGRYVMLPGPEFTLRVLH